MNNLLIYLLTSILSLLLVVNNVKAEDPGLKVLAYGIKYSTAAVIKRMTNHLFTPTAFGRAIRVKDTGECVDSAWQTGPSTYSPFPNFCDPNTRSQRFRLLNGYLRVGSRGLYPALDPTLLASCLTCTSRAEDCYLEIQGCNNSLSQQYMIRVHARQINLAQEKIYFSLHSKLHKDRCMTRYESDTKGGTTYDLEDCSGSNKQSFYMNLDLGRFIEEIRAQIRKEESNGLDLGSFKTDNQISNATNLLESY